MDVLAVVATEVAVVRASCALGHLLVGFPLVLPAPPPLVVRSMCAHMLGVHGAFDQYVLQQRVPSGEWVDAVAAFITGGATPVNRVQAKTANGFADLSAASRRWARRRWSSPTSSRRSRPRCPRAR
jgi:hypothetical protein